MYVCMYMYAYMYECCMCVCIYVYMYVCGGGGNPVIPSRDPLVVRIDIFYWLTWLVCRLGIE